MLGTQRSFWLPNTEGSTVHLPGLTKLFFMATYFTGGDSVNSQRSMRILMESLKECLTIEECEPNQCSGGLKNQGNHSVDGCQNLKMKLKALLTSILNEVLFDIRSYFLRTSR